MLVACETEPIVILATSLRRDSSCFCYSPAPFDKLRKRCPELIEGRCPESTEGRCPELVEGRCPELIEGRCPESTERLAP